MALNLHPCRSTTLSWLLSAKSALALALSFAAGVQAQQFEAEGWTTMLGLQTEVTTDAGGGQNVGWIDANDWAEYANRAIAPGNYRVEARVATMSANRIVQIWVDGTQRTTVTQVAATGGWQTWATAISGTINIASGSTHTVRLVFPGNNMNLNWFRFVPQSSDVTPPTVPGGLNSPSKANTLITLSWTASTDAVGVTAYDIYRNGTLAGTVTAPATTYLVTGLAASTSYNLTVLAKDAAGNASGQSAALAVTTNGVTNLLTNGDFASGLAPWVLYQGVNLNIAGQYGVNSPVTTNVYDVNLVQIRALTVGTPYTLTFRARSNVSRSIVGGWGLAQAPWTSQNMVFTLSTGWTLYSFSATSTVPTLANSRVFFDVGGPIAGEVHIDDVSLSAGGGPPPDTQAPTVPTNLASPSRTNTTVNLAWTASTDNVGVTGYDVYRAGDLIGSPATASYQATGLLANTSYAFTVRAKDAAGNASAQTAALNATTTGPDIEAPTAPGNLSSSAQTAVAITLNWTASTDNVGVIAYDLYRNGAFLQDLGVVTSYTVGGLIPGTAYTFQVRARDAANNAASSNTLSISTPADQTAPTVPANLTASGLTNTGVTLTWTASSDLVGVTGYDIYRGGVAFGTSTLTTLTTNVLTAGTAYSFTVRARDAAGNLSAFTPALAVTTPNQPPPTSLTIQAESWSRMLGLQTEATTDAGGGLNAGWIDALDWAEYDNQQIPAGIYKLEARMATMATGRQVQLSIDGVLTTTVTQQGASGGWQTWVTATSGDFTVTGGPNHLVRLGFPLNNMNINWVRFVPSGPDVTAPTAPTNLASPSQTGNALNLTWIASTDAVGVSGYEIWVNGAFRSTVTGAVQAGQVTGLTPSTQYTVRILAYDAAGNKSGNSNTITVSTTDGSNLAGTYALRNRNSNLCVEVAGGGTANGDPVIQNVCNGSRAQKWELAPGVVAGYYTLKNVNSGKMLDVKDAGASDDMQQWDAGGNAAQDYSIQAAATAGHHTLKARSGLTECLDILGGSAAAGAILRTVACAAGSASQNFALVPTEATTACVAGAAATSTIATQEIWAGQGFVQPMELVQEPAASGNAYIVMDKTGMVRRVLESPTDNVNRVFFDMSGRITTSGESGLAALAFDPQYGAGNRYVYVTYLSNNPHELRLSRFTANSTGTSVDLNTEVRLFSFARTSDIHHSGALAFGPGPVAGQQYLYLSVGDNGNNAVGDLSPVKVTQNNWPHGKILRLTQADYRSAGTLPWNYAAGANNAYIVATGLRNPWRMSFDGNDLWISNVGFDKYEEINKFNVLTETGTNFGWPWCEGPVCCAEANPAINCNLAGMPPMPNNLTLPVHSYHRNDGTTGEGAVIGGFVYRGTQVPALTGKYVFAEFVDQIIYALDPVTKVRTTILTGMGNVADIGQDRNGEILLTDYGRSNIYKIIPGAGGPTLPWPPANLAEAGCFESLNNGDPIPKASVSRFNVAQKFWSDGADKERMISVPAGARVDVANQDDWMLPPGGVTIKNFFWNNSIFETRLFVRHTNGTHAGYTYKWTGPNTANLVTTENDTKDLGGGMIWKYPSRAQCMTCHNEKISGSIALESRQMNVDGQITTFHQMGLLNSPIANPHPPFPDHLDEMVPLPERAEAYMHVNCASCHRGPGESAAGQADWDARATIPLASRRACDETPEPPVSGNLAERIIKPGDPDLSTVWLRAHQRVNLYMPPLGSQVPDSGGVAILRQWIQGLTGCN